MLRDSLSELHRGEFRCYCWRGSGRFAPKVIDRSETQMKMSSLDRGQVAQILSFEIYACAFTQAPTRSSPVVGQAQSVLLSHLLARH